MASDSSFQEARAVTPEMRARAAELEIPVEEYERLSRPFHPDIVAEAARVANRYRMFVEWNEDEGLYFAGSEEHGYVCGHGTTRAEAIEMAAEGMFTVVASELESGTEPLASRTGERRT